ncbi:S-layer homology domain-containing protein [Paenibacillus jiagnxiensis]|uniref:S-layer homology domain-containing protein n=1 Tax=Paenibacillus jiagnxiensis TaxID=3228926 RepID=UPI0033BA766A
MAIVMVLTILPFQPSQVRAAAAPALDLGTPVRSSETAYQLSNAAFGSAGVVDPAGGYFTVAVNNGSIAVGTLASSITELTNGIKIIDVVTDQSTPTNRVFNFSGSNTYADIQDAIEKLTFTQASGKSQKVTVNVMPGAPLSDGKTSVRTYNGRHFVYVARQNSMTFNDAVTTARNNSGHLVEPSKDHPEEMLAIASLFKEFKSPWAGTNWSFISFIGATKTAAATNWSTPAYSETRYVTNGQPTGLESSKEFVDNGQLDHLTLLLDTNNTKIGYLAVNNTHGGSSAYKDPGVIVEYNAGVISDVIMATTDVASFKGGIKDVTSAVYSVYEGSGAITATPLDVSTVMSITDLNGDPVTGYKAYDQKGNEIQPDANGWYPSNGEPIVFRPLLPGGTYKVVASTTFDAVTTPKTATQSEKVTLPTVTVDENVATGQDPEHPGKTTITVDPSSKLVKYAIADEQGNVVSEWVPGTGSEITFDNLDPNTNYQIVAIPVDTAEPLPTTGVTGTIVKTPEADNQEKSLLKELQVTDEDGSKIGLSPEFDPNQTSYKATVSNDVYSISINPAAQYPEDTEIRVNLNGVSVSADDWDNLPLQEGKNTVTVGVYDKNGNLLNEYTIEITRERASIGGKLTSLVPSEGSLDPAFNPDRTSYTMSVGKSVYEMQLTPTSLDPNAKIEIRVNDGEWQEVTSGSLSDPLALNRGSNTIVVRVTDEDGQSREYTVTVYRSSGSSSNDDDNKGGSGGGGGGSTTKPTTPDTSDAPKGNLDVTLNGNDNPFATGTVSTSNGRTVTSVKVDQGKLADAISQGNGQKLAIHSPSEGDMSVEGLTAETLKQLSEKGASLEISNLLAIYPVPAGKMDLSSVADQLGNAALSDIGVRIDIKRASEDVIASAKSKAAAAGYELLVDPVDLDLTFSNGGQTAKSGQLNGYAVRYIALPDGIDPNRITTGVVVNPDGSVYHLPTVITKINSRYFAQINDLRSSGTYSVIWNPQDFDDVRNHWGKEDVNNIAARLDLKGNGNNTFSPDRSVTRSEFAEIVVTGLGLMRTDAPQPNFTDVSASAWYAKAVAIANEFDIVRGYEDGNFYGDKQITREQGFSMIARAYRLIQSEDAAGQDTTALAQYTDGAKVSNWAKADVAQLIQAGIIQGNGTKLNPQATMTRAEVTALIARMLKSTNLIDQ